METWSMSWTTGLWRNGKGRESPHSSLTSCQSQERQLKEQLILRVDTCLHDWPHRVGFSLPNHRALWEQWGWLDRGGMTEVGLNWWHYCWCSCGTQDDFAQKLIWKNESLATCPIQQMTLTVPEQVRVHKQIRRRIAAPSLAAATFTYTGWDLICLQPDLRQLCLQWLRSHKPMPTAWMPAEGLSCWGSTWEDLF